MAILVAGGTGFVGSAIVEELLRRGLPVAVLGRDEARIRRKFGDRVVPRIGDVGNEAQLVTAFQGIETVINAVQFPNNPIEDPSKGYTFEQVDYIGTTNQVDAAKTAGVKRFVYVSGVGAAPTVEQHWFRFKWLAEQHVMLSGLEWTIVRPTWVYGPGDHSLNKIVGFGKFLPFIPLFSDGKQDMQPVFIDDLARVIADAATLPEGANELFEVGGPQVMSMNEVINTSLEVQGKKRPILHQPVIVGKALGTIASFLPVAKKQLSSDAVEFIIQPAVADNLNAAVRLKPKFTLLRDGMASYMAKK